MIYRPEDHYRVEIVLDERDANGQPVGYQFDFDHPVPLPAVGDVVRFNVAPEGESYRAGHFRVKLREFYLQQRRYGFDNGEGAWWHPTLVCERIRVNERVPLPPQREEKSCSV